METEDISSKVAFREDFRNLWGLSDGKISTEDGYVYQIHKFMLAKSSKYFYALFFGMNATKKDILIPGIKGDVLGSVLRYICTGDIHLSSYNLIDVLVAADYLLVNDLFLKAKEHAKNNPSVSTCCSIFSTALDLNLKDVCQESFRYIQTHFEDIVNDESSKVEILPVDSLKELLCYENLCVRNYFTVWHSIVRWIEFDIDRRQVHLPDLLTCLDIERMDEDLASFIVNHHLVAHNSSCKDINDLKKSKDFKTDRQILSISLNKNKQVDSGLKDQSSKLYFIQKKKVKGWMSGSTDIYVTYDENFDLWRKITEVPFVPRLLLSIGSCIYAIHPMDRHSSFSLHSFDCVTKQWKEMESLEDARRPSTILKHEGLIYLLAGYRLRSYREVYRADVFSPALNVWTSISPMLPVSSPLGVSLGKIIYAIGKESQEEEEEMSEEEEEDEEDEDQVPQNEEEGEQLAAEDVLDVHEDEEGENEIANEEEIESDDEENENGIADEEEGEPDDDGQENGMEGEEEIEPDDGEHENGIADDEEIEPDDDEHENGIADEEGEEPNDEEDVDDEEMLDLDEENVNEDELADQQMEDVNERDFRWQPAVVAQEYNPEQDTWTALPSPTTIRHIFEFVAFHNKVYLIGKALEDREYATTLAAALDPDSREWENLPDLPFKYNDPRAIILDDRLIIYENNPTDRLYLHFAHNAFPSVRWNDELKTWETVEGLPISAHFHQYVFHEIEEEEALKFMKKENRDMNNSFVKSNIN